MPKGEFDFDDPMELNGVGLMCNQDTTEAMTECFIEEFMRLGYNHKQLLALFRNPHYIGMNLALQNRGEAFVREKITEVFARWGKPIVWRDGVAGSLSLSPSDGERAGVRGHADPSVHPDAGPPHDSSPAHHYETDPMGAPIPDVTL